MRWWNGGRTPSRAFSRRRPRKIIGAPVKQCACARGADASDTGPGRLVALDIGNAVDRSAAHFPRATAVARAGSGADGDVYRCHCGAACFPHTVGHVGGCECEGRMGRRLHPVCDLAGAAPVSDHQAGWCLRRAAAGHRQIQPQRPVHHPGAGLGVCLIPAGHCRLRRPRRRGRAAVDRYGRQADPGRRYGRRCACLGPVFRHPRGGLAGNAASRQFGRCR